MSGAGAADGAAAASAAGGGAADGPLAGRCAIVTGASRGIGLSVAATLAAAGASVVLTARRAESAQAAAESIGVGGRAVGFGAHAADEEAAQACVAFALERFGRLDVLVNNAGTNPAYGPLLEAEHGRVMKTFEVNLWAPLLWSGLVARAWMAEHGGAIVNVASIGGLKTSEGTGVYNASKAGLIHLTRQLAVELSPRIRVNAVAPGVVRTKLAEALWQHHEEAVIGRTPLDRIGEPPDVAQAVLFLAGDGASWITGETMTVDGGQLLGAPQASARASLDAAAAASAAAPAGSPEPRASA